MNIALPPVQTIESANEDLKNFVNKNTARNPEFNRTINDYFNNRIVSGKNNLDEKISNLSPKEDLDKLMEQVTNIIHDTEILVDSHMGVIRSTSKDPEIAFVGNDREDAKSYVTLRDARYQNDFRNPKLKADFVPEASVVIAASQLKGILQIIKDADTGNKDQAVKEAVGLFKAYKIELLESKSIAERKNIINNLNTELAVTLRENDLVIAGKPIKKFQEEELAEGMGLVRDLTNLLDDKHSSVVTVTDIGGENLHVSGTIRVKPLSTEIEKRYNNEDSMKKWTCELNPFLKHSLKGDFIDKITDGKHVISSQLPIPGLRNAAFEATFVKGSDSIYEDKGMLRSGTPAHNNGKGKDKDLRDTITAENLEHMVALSGNKEVDLTVLNSDTVVFGEKKIVNGIREGIKKYKQRLNGEPSLLKGSNENSDYSQKGISVSHNKTRHVEEVAKAFEEEQGDSIQWDSCKSGKDRTQAMVSQNVLNTISKLKDLGLNIDVKEAQRRIVLSGHGNAVASGPGTSYGTNGTKISNVYKFLGGDSVLLDHKEQLKTKIADFNHVELNKNLKVTNPKRPVIIAKIEAEKLNQNHGLQRSGSVLTQRPKRPGLGQSVC